MTLKFIALPTDTVRMLQAGGPDANGQPPERHASDGSGNPCRHCLRDIPAGAQMLILAYRPFSQAQPYAETGPIFLCADACERHRDSDALPDMFLGTQAFIVRGYGADERILYGTGQVVKTSRLVDAVSGIFQQRNATFVHMRSASNNCYQCKIERT